VQALAGIFRFNNAEREKAERKYAGFRSATFKDVSRRMQLSKRYKLDEINPQAIKTYKEVWMAEERLVDWDWPREVARFQRNCTSRIELAIWQEKHLCGLMVGNTSKQKNILYVQGIEGAPYKHPLKGEVIPLCIEVAESYAKSIGCTELRIINPEPAVMPLYAELGYNKVSNFSDIVKIMGE
jgi:hypothetical protein